MNTSPLTYAIVGDHLQLTFTRKHPAPTDITYLYEVTSDLLSGNWDSGPAFVSESATDNLDGTETVMVTVNPAVSDTATRYVRLRISQP